ncbi:uncharacterized protein LOC123014841 [Tribolium madens]|uniref:uncharacterized protein LOC123014841 n=1 Tax=Tribolium madens TaxID=41895 RepID=UPI001CF735A9|nr:uncharacterized protein LOC123014841 [Tribolium madens]
MAPTLYMMPSSPPVRAVLMTAKSIGLDLELKQLNLRRGDHKTAEYLKLNPQHTVPTLVDDDGFVLWDSHAIIVYLLSKYAKNDSLYPKDLKKRAVIDQRMHFDSGVAFSVFLTILYPLIYREKKTITQEDKNAAEEVYSFLEAFLEGKQWMTGDSVTVADYSLIATISSLNVLVKIDPVKYSKLNTWVKNVEKLPAYEANKSGLEQFVGYVNSISGSIMSLKLYHTSLSPACRASLLTINALGIEVELVPINLNAQEHLTTEFLQLNPFHTVPTLQDGSFSLCDSHAINAYLVENYGTDDSLYPKDLQQKAIVNQRLHFDSNVLSARLSAITSSILRGGAKTVAKDKADALLQGLTLLETILETNKFVCGDKLSIADFSLVTTVSSANAVLPLASNRFPKIFEWWNRLEALPYYKEANQEGLNAFTKLIKSKNIMRQNSTR